ncbi:hypothetical protein CVT26_007912, partial [Gymnopilus dilepis]
YGQRYTIVILPSILWLAGFGVTAWETFNEDNIPEYNFMLNVTYTIFWVITVILKLYTTIMVVVRIWRVENATRPPPATDFSIPEDEIQQQTNLRKVLRIVIESGLIYTAVSFLALCSQVAMSNSVYISTSAILLSNGISNPPVRTKDVIIIGISFNLIHIRVAHTRTKQRRAKENSISTIQFEEHMITTTRSCSPTEVK